MHLVPSCLIIRVSHMKTLIIHRKLGIGLYLGTILGKCTWEWAIYMLISVIVHLALVGITRGRMWYAIMVVRNHFILNLRLLELYY